MKKIPGSDFHLRFKSTVCGMLSGVLYGWLLLAAPPALRATPPDSYIITDRTENAFTLAESGKAAPLWASSQDFPGVIKVLKLFQSDIQAVTGAQPPICLDQIPEGREVVIIGTIGKSQVIDKLISENKLDVTGIADKWEAFLIQAIEKPLPGVERALVIAGSDKRGTIYGMFDMSEKIGVSPWYWWADVPVKKKAAIYIKPGSFSLGEPKVKYRGIFINDEAPALSGWVNEKFGGFNHEFYEHVFELLLRLKANHLWPGMWGKYFGADPENPRLADEYGIVMGSSHCEPLLYNNDPGAGLWNSKTMGPWRYDINRDNIYKVLDKNVASRYCYENVYTVGLRGIHDTHMEGGVDIPAQIALLEQVFRDQREILSKHIDKDITEIPQVFVPYKEVQEYYDAGLRVPDDVTIMWSDDNWGNIRRLPKLTDPPRAGGYGIYYHFDYVGDPRNYKWLNTSQISRIWEQMHLAYEYGCDRIWIMNVGDIKPMEFPISFAMDYAWNPEAWPAGRLPEYSRQWATEQFGPQYAPEIAMILEQYTRFNSRRKPELLAPETYSLVNFREAEKVVSEYNELARKARKIYEALPAEYRDAFYQLVLHPTEACANLNDLYYTVAKNRLYAEQGRAKTNSLADKARVLFQKDAEITDFYNHVLAQGKWNHMMDQTHIGYTYWQQPDSNSMPEVKEIRLSDKAEMGIALEGSTEYWPASQNAARLPEFDPYNQSRHYLEIFNRGNTPFKFTIKSSDPCLIFSRSGGQIDQEERIWIEIDWKKARTGKYSVPVIITGPPKSQVEVMVIVNNPALTKFDVANRFVESSGFIAMEAEHYSRVKTAGGLTWQRIPELGRTLSAMTPFPVTMTSRILPQDSPCLEYDVYLLNSGQVSVTAYLSPTLNFPNEQGLRYGVSFDDEPVQVINMHAGKTYNDWQESVSNNITIMKSVHELDSVGKHTLKIWTVDPGVVLQKLVIATGNVPSSYLGASESKLVKAAQ
jgi:hypothetical protein